MTIKGVENLRETNQMTIVLETYSTILTLLLRVSLVQGQV